MSQRDFATAAGLNTAFAGRVERGLQNLTLTAVARVALALDVPVEALFTGIVPGREVLEIKPRRKLRRRVVAAKPPEGEPAPASSKRRRPSKGTAAGKATAPDAEG